MGRDRVGTYAHTHDPYVASSDEEFCSGGADEGVNQDLNPVVYVSDEADDEECCVQQLQQQDHPQRQQAPQEEEEPQPKKCAPLQAPLQAPVQAPMQAPMQAPLQAPTLVAERAHEKTTMQPECAVQLPEVSVPAPRGRGRPKGSRSKLSLKTNKEHASQRIKELKDCLSASQNQLAREIDTKKRALHLLHQRKRPFVYNPPCVEPEPGAPPHVQNRDATPPPKRPRLSSPPAVKRVCSHSHY